MSTLVIELFEVCHGTGTADPSPLLIASDIATRAAANALRDSLDAQKTAGELDPTTYPANLSFYVRAKSGEQTITTVNSAPLDIIAELGTAQVSIATYWKIDGSYVAVAPLPLSLIRLQPM